MNAATQQEALRHAIEYAGRECEADTRLAHFAENDPYMPKTLATSLRKLAAYHSENAFACAAKLQVVA